MMNRSMQYPAGLVLAGYSGGAGIINVALNMGPDARNPWVV